MIVTFVRTGCNPPSGTDDPVVRYMQLATYLMVGWQKNSSTHPQMDTPHKKSVSYTILV
jgi:hypothetical protein